MKQKSVHSLFCPCGVFLSFVVCIFYGFVVCIFYGFVVLYFLWVLWFSIFYGFMIFYFLCVYRIYSTHLSHASMATD